MKNKQLLLATVLCFGAALAQAADERPQITFNRAAIAKPSVAVKSAKPERTSEKKESSLPAGALVVSDRDFNIFVFPEPVTKLIFNSDAPVQGDPVYLAGRTQALVQFSSNSDKPFKMIAELSSQAIVSSTLVARPVDSTEHLLAGAKKQRAGKAPAKASVVDASGVITPRGEDMDLLKQFVAGALSDGFEPVKLPRPARFDKFTVIPLEGWSDGSRRIMKFSLVTVPGETAVVSPPQFYREGISAVLIDGDVVDGSNSPTLYVVEELQNE